MDPKVGKTAHETDQGAKIHELDAMSTIHGDEQDGDECVAGHARVQRSTHSQPPASPSAQDAPAPQTLNDQRSNCLKPQPVR